MTTRTSKALLLMVVLALASLAAARPAQASVRVDIGFFYDSLAPYGTWYEHPSYGWVWAPQAISTSWRPYVDGHWAYANEYGWTWASSDPWGWATDHYGRWFYDDYCGCWIWVPGYEWAPAWVDWVSYDGYVGWAPLPPSAYWSVNVGFAPRYDVGYDRYVFVEPRYLGSTSWQRYAAPRDRAVRWAREGRRITRYQSYGDRIVNRSVGYAPNTAVQVVEVASPTSLRRTLDRGQLTVFRPQVTRNTRIQPPHQAREPRGRGIGLTRQRESQRIAVPPAPRRLALVERGERERRPVVTTVRPQRTVERVAPAPRRNLVAPRIERSRGPVVSSQRTVRQAPASRRPAITRRIERRTVVTQRMPQRATRQLAPAPSERRPTQMNRGHEWRRTANPPQRPARQKHDRRNGRG